MGAEYVDEGGILLPAPEKLFVFTSTRCSDDSLTGTSSVSLHSSEKDAESVILFNQKNKAGFFTLKQEVCQCNQCKKNFFSLLNSLCFYLYDFS